ncbi:MAG: hypothetical protein FE78DRAFT_27998 [Acidomyces sp. 'richmondensis']|nr:MAG: hypothetical protein FE78DRAFT_27998 [Acidomyces sp. 'richmondensis']
MDNASSRIFIKGLPPTLTEAEFRKIFSQKSEITDAKIFPSRRIGYVGYKTPEDAQNAVKYFNKSFIRMSRIGVELARPPVQDSKAKNHPEQARMSKEENGGELHLEQGNIMKRRRDDDNKEEEDPKLREFLNIMRPKKRKKAWESEEMDVCADVQTLQHEADAVEEGESGEEYEEIPKIQARSKPREDTTLASLPQSEYKGMDAAEEQPHFGPEHNGDEIPRPAMSDADWARSRTSRLLDVDDDEDQLLPANRKNASSTPEDIDDAKTTVGAIRRIETSPKVPSSDDQQSEPGTKMKTEIDAVQESMRLFVRNLPYSVTKEDLEAEFAQFGNIEEAGTTDVLAFDVHIPLDHKTGAAKGFAYILFNDPEAAKNAFTQKDGSTFQGRLLHILAASDKRGSKLDDFALSKLPLKKQLQIKRRRQAASSTFNWNALYMNADAVVSTVAERLGLSKSEVLDPTSSNAAVRQAHAETHIIQETKSYFMQQGIDLDTFKKKQRGETAILVKNIPYDCAKDELRRLFEAHGDVKRFLMPPSGIIAIVEFANSAQCKSAFSALAYKKVKSSILFLEKAPKDLFSVNSAVLNPETGSEGVTKISASELKEKDHVVPDTAGTSTLFVRNLNFSTTTELLTETFKPLDGFMSARVKTKTDPKKPGQVLSMGFGFLEFRTAQQAQSALSSMDGYNLEGHKLQLRVSNRALDATEKHKIADLANKAANKKTKIIIKNLPFEATKKDIRSLFGAYGQLRSVRVPKKMDRAARGFAFADFTTPKEAESAMEALRDTHLLGRRLVLEFAAGDTVDPEDEIEKMMQKVGGQVNKVALQSLTSSGRKKFTTAQSEND